MQSFPIYELVSHIVYLSISIAATVCVARTLHRHGRIFLVDTFRDEALADAVNSLLVVGFYLINIGYVAITIENTGRVDGPVRLITENGVRIGRVLIALGAMHFFNLYIFSRLRRRARLQSAHMPIESHEQVPTMAPLS